MTQPPPEPPAWGPPTTPPPPPPPPVWGPPPPYPPFPSFQAPPGPKRGRGRLVIAVVAALVVLAGAVVVPLVLLDGDDEPGPSAGGDPTGAAGSGAPSDLSAVEVYDDLPTTHVEEPVDYEQVPPVGGAHFPEWLDCGVYDAPVPDENAVHDLEHGTVWITYLPDLPDDAVDTLADQLPQNGILSPYDDLPAPVVVTVWGRQLRLTGADDPRLAMFVAEFQDGVTAPEPMASCAGGTASATGGGPTA